jgi:heterodisulfide reductase subunit A2
MSVISETKREADPCRILVMEDESSVAKGLEKLLKDRGHRVHVVGTGQAALDVLDQDEISLLVADMELPDMSGMEVVRRTRKKKPDTGIIVISGTPSVPSAVEAMKTGVLDYLPKPFTPEDFVLRVERALAGKGQADSGSAENAEAQKDTVRAHVLVAEDAPAVGKGLKMLLTTKGYGVDLVTTGKQALEEIDRKDFDLLVTDLRLPDMNGTEVICGAKRKRPQTAVIVMTGFPSVSTAVEAMKSGAADFLEKPFTQEEFLQRVVNTLNGGGDPISTAPLKMGFYVCHGGTDIANKIRINDLVSFARKQEHVAIAREATYLCREPELRMIEEDIRRLGLNRVIVGACGPKAAERAFQEACKREGLDPEYVHTLSLREEVAWVAEDPPEATRRAKILAAAAFHRAKYHSTMATREVAVRPEVLVVGGGIAGMQAALDVAESGHKVFLVERQPTIGGHMLQFDKTFPTLDCAACIGTPKMVSVGQNPNIELLTCSEVIGVSGMVGDYRVKILRNPRYVKEGVCTGCGECANVCPVTRPSEWDQGLVKRKAIYRPFPQAVPITFTIDKSACLECHKCEKVCEAKAIDHSMKPEEVEIHVGSIILATGYDLMDTTPMTQYGYARYPNVLTSLEFERLNNSTGPTNGQILMRDKTGAFTTPPQAVAIIHCVGSRDKNYHEYCSRVCCMYALKYGHLLKDKLGPHTRVYDFYVDMRCFGKGYEEFYIRCQEEGILFFRGKPSEVSDQALAPQEEGKLVVIGEDTLLNKDFRIPVDMVILCAAVEARKDSEDLAKRFGIRRGADGFFSEDHATLGPLNTGSAGIFLAGACQGPKDIPDTVAHASGAAAMALDLVIVGKVEVPVTMAWIDPDACQGCRTCIKLCPHSAITYDAQRERSSVNQAACNGCGLCAAACPQGAAHLWQYREDRILTELDGIQQCSAAVG